MRNQFSVVLALLLTISFTHYSYGVIDDKSVSSVQKKLGLMAVEVDNPIEAQVPEQFFAPDPKTNVVTPPQSFTTAQRRFMALKGREKKIVEQVKANQNNKFLVTVSIIDSGMDTLNDFASSIIDWKVKDGKVVGAGRDYLSDSPWGIPQLQDPWIYAIGAEGIDPHFRIIGAQEKPIEFLVKLNGEIMSAIEDAVKQNPNLKNTFFTKLNSNNTNMIGLLRILGYQPDEVTIAQLDKEKRLLSMQTSPLNVNPQDASLHRMASTAWIMSPDAGLPDFLSLFELEKLKGLNEFRQTIETVLGGERGKAVQKLIGNQAKYFRGHHFEENIPVEMIQAYTMAKLSEQLAFKKIGTQIYNPSYEFYLTLRKLKAVYPNLTWDQVIDRAIAVYSGILDTMQRDIRTQNDIADLSVIKGQLANLNMVKKFIFEGSKNKDFEAILKHIEQTGRTPWIPGESSLYRKFVMRTKQPDMHKEAEFHGTHVGTTGEAYLGKRYRANSGRVGLGMIKGNLTVQEKLAKKNLEAMYEWFRKPVVARALLDTLKNDGILDTPQGASLPKTVNTPQEINKIALFMAERYGSFLMMDGSQSGTVGLELHWKLIDRMKEDAAEKRTIGNLSLGGESSFPSRHAVLDTPEEKLGSKMSFIFNEFQKYILAEALATHGKNTLFFMAAGNSNNVGDGFTQSDFPADLRPKWLEQYKLPGEADLPGEKVSNIAIVMSANEDGRRSGFSNMIFTDNAQFMARGENINSSAMAYSMHTSSTIIKARYPEVFRAQAFLGTIDEKDSRVGAAMERMGVRFEEFSMLRSLLGESISMISSHLALKYNDQRAEISGTSMGSPEVAFFLAEMLSKKLEKQGIWEHEAYGKPGFTPTDLLKDLVAETKMVPVGTTKNSVASIFEKQKYVPRSEKAKALQKTLNTIRESNIICVRFYGGK